MKGVRSVRPLAPDSLRGIVPGKPGKLPKFEWVDPRTLYVEEAYQRSLGGNSTALIRKIVAGFSWARFKAPICVRLQDFGNVLVCVDGQHTAIAAASHAGVPKIPVMVVAGDDVAARASAFVGHNRDRIALTQMAIFHAELASGDPLAEVMKRACDETGAAILTKSVNLRDKLPVGSTIAVGTIRRVAKGDGEAFLIRVLGMLVRAGRGPIKAHEIAAVAIIMREDAERKLDLRLQRVVASKTAEKWSAIASKEVADLATSRRDLPDALSNLWLRELDERIAQPPVNRKAAPVNRKPDSVNPEPEIVNSAPLPPPPAPAKVTAAKAAGGASVVVIEHNGVAIDLTRRSVTFRGREVVVGEDEAALMVAALARVMPAFLPPEIVARSTFGRADAADRIALLADRTNRSLAGAQLEIRSVMKMGWMMATLE